MTDDEFMAKFEDGSLPSESFHHLDHVKMTFLYLSRYPPGRPPPLFGFAGEIRRSKGQTRPL